MMDLALKDNDLEILNGDFCLCQNDFLATAQNIKIRLKTLAGEWFLDSNIGLPYLTKVLGKKPNNALLTHLISKEILSVPNVKECSDFSFDEGLLPRSLKVKFKVTLFDQSQIFINELVGI